MPFILTPPPGMALFKKIFLIKLKIYCNKNLVCLPLHEISCIRILHAVF